MTMTDDERLNVLQDWADDYDIPDDLGTDDPILVAAARLVNRYAWFDDPVLGPSTVLEIVRAVLGPPPTDETCPDAEWRAPTEFMIGERITTGALFIALDNGQRIDFPPAMAPAIAEMLLEIVEEG